ncbi:MAG TPA: NYN domain-containing protein [Geminocystis sp. M7585_C2015_104]|nr:NYN domain-containing protein [Geminocystis sp. M7585_C2015_104]
MNGNTAIFYDVENLLKGYSLEQKYISKISLKSIFQEIISLPQVERVLVQKAYANWSDYRLSFMKKEINELGIEPVQIFGFSYYQKKNAADIQLAVDAIDLAYVRKNIDVFVIVSGDGGFSAVARKLHEYGKYVIGCGYKYSTNQVFESICDQFITIEEPDKENNSENRTPEEDKKESEKTQITHPLILRMSKSLERISSDNREEIIQHSLKILQWFAEDKEAAKLLSSSGIYVSVVREAFKYGIKDFHPSKVGFPKFVKFLQYICRDTDLQILIGEKCQAKIAFRDATIEAFIPLPPLDDNFVHSPENYRDILETQKPRIIVIDSEDFLKITAAITLLSEEYTLNTIQEKINQKYPEINGKTLIDCLNSLVNIEVISYQEKENNQRFFRLKEEFREHRSIIKKYKESIYNKLSKILGKDLRESVIEQIILDC